MEKAPESAAEVTKSVEKKKKQRKRSSEEMTTPAPDEDQIMQDDAGKPQNTADDKGKNKK